MIMRAKRATVTAMRRSGARAISISAVTQSELLYGAHLNGDGNRLEKVRKFLARMKVCPWDAQAAEAHAMVRAGVRAKGRGAGVFDLMIVGHAVALGHVLVTSDRAIANLRLAGLRVVEW